MTERLPRLVLLVLIVGLALHNVVMALLHGAGVTGVALDVVAAWKETLLLVGLAAAVVAVGAVPRLLWPDRLALAYTAVVVAYLVVPQSWLGGEATARGELLAARHHLLAVGAYALGRLVLVTPAWWRRVGLAIVAVACGVAVLGLVDVYLVPLQWWRDSGVPGWFGEQLGLVYRCLSGLPENWILNTGDEQEPLRRLVSTFLSPLAAAYLLVVALLLLAAARPRRLTIAAAARRVRRPPVDAHARRLHRPRPRARRPRSPATGLASGRARGRVAGGVGRLRGGVPDDRADDVLHGGRARVPPGERSRRRW